jgi:tetratricopeptide (TPR) repeat protein
LARGDDPNRHAITVAYYEARVRLRPGDPSAHLDLALAHFDAAKEWGPIIHGSVAGPLVTRSFGAERFPQAVVHEHIELGLRSLRTARDLCPSFPEVQGALGIYGRFFTHADLPIKYLDRSLKLLPSDGNTWAIAGTEAWRSGDEAGAIQHWKKALELSPLELTYVLRTINTRLSPAVIRDRILPDDPIVLLGAANSIYPDRVAQAAERRPFLEGAAAALGRPTLTDAQCVAIADACQQLNRPNDVVAAWRKAIELAPRKIEYRNRFARWLEAEERYEEVIEHLEWMLDQDPRNLELPDRILIARHGAKLQQEIGR